ncbi:MAG: hypothetical protein GAK43_00765 [Stenotrophomonas maltophilia]|nr:MAG: hypothetical protein GAK43_00765 [Stenotrophomonas maltophilia]
MSFLTRSHKPLAEARDHTLEEIHALIGQIDDLLQEGKDATVDQVPALKERLHSALHGSRELLGRGQRQLVQGSRQAVRATGEYVGEHPWQATALAGIGLGIAAAALLRRH